MKTAKSGIGERRGTSKRRTPASEQVEAHTDQSGTGASVIVSEPNPREADSPEREARIRAKAYLRAKERGFAGGDAVVDWLEAEREIAEEERKADGERNGGVVR